MKEKAKQKAIELIEKFENETHSLVKDDLAKKCALIAVDEILKLDVLLKGHLESEFEECSFKDTEEFWNEVKNQLNDM